MRAFLAVLLLALAGCVGQAQPVPLGANLGLPEAVQPGVHAFALAVAGEPARGLVAVPATGSSGTLVVLAKGLGAKAEDWQPVLDSLAARGALAVAMDYRGATGAWKVRAAVDDTLAAVQAMRAAHPEITRVVLYGYSMGGEASGLLVARAPPGTFTVWVAGSGVMDLRAEWAAAPAYQPLIEAEAGGSPLQAPAAYAALSPVEQVQAIAGKGLEHVYLVHGAADTVVPAEQGIRMEHALAAAGVPTSLTLVASEPGGWLCVPFVEMCQPSRLPDAPAGHEAGWTQVVPTLLDALADGRAPQSVGVAITEGWSGAQVALPVPASPSPRPTTLGA